ncbi:MAG: hypothetical protein AMXMBFR7_06190 [Planctomycetota bacterium]
MACVNLVIVLIASFAPHARAATIPPPPDPGLEASIRAADCIAEVEILAGGPFRAAAKVLRTFKGEAPALIELEGYNSLNGDTASGGFAGGDRYILFLSRTGKPDLFTTLTPTAPRLAVTDDGVNLVLGDPPFTVPVRPESIETALKLVLERERTGQSPDGALDAIRALWEKDELEQRYLAVALAGMLRDERATGLAIEAAQGRLLRLRLTGIEALRKIATPEALAALRPLGKDRRATVGLEAARALVALRDLESVPALLDWAARAAAELAKLPDGDARKKPTQLVLNQLFFWLDEEGALLPPEQLVPPLLELAKSPEDGAADNALFVLGSLARRDHIQRLIDLADDPVYTRRDEARVALFRATSRPVDDLDRFRAWWQEARTAFGEDQRRTVVEQAARALATLPDDESRVGYTAVLRVSPAELALVSAAPLLLNETSAAAFTAADLGYWRSPLVLPFLLERLGHDSYTERRTGLDGAAFMASRYPRLAPLVRPFVRGALYDEYSGMRRSAASAAGSLQDTRAAPHLIDLLRGNGYEAADAGRAVFQLTARTLGYSSYEPLADEEAAAERLGDWWTGWSAAHANAAYPLPFPPTRVPALTDPLDPAELEAACLGADSRASAAALAILLERRKPSDPLWAKLLASSRVRDKAQGVTGRIGGDAALADELGRLVAGSPAQADLVRAQALVALGSLEGGAGAAWIVRWLQGAGSSAPLPYRRLAVVLLGLGDGEPLSRAYLSNLVTQAVPVEASLIDIFVKRPEDALLRAALAALCARSDGTEGLRAGMRLTQAALRETAARALVMQRRPEVFPGLFDVLALGDAYTLPPFVRLCAPLIQAPNAGALRAMLSSTKEGARIAASGILALRPDLAADAETVAVLIPALRDSSDTVREQAAQALGKARAQQAVQPLAMALADLDTGVKAAAAEALARIGDRRACQLAAVEAQALLRIDPRWLRALGIAGGEEELALLLRFAKSTALLDQSAGLEGLGVCPRPEALARLLEVFHNRESKFQTHAARALQDQGNAAVEGLASDLASTDVQVRARALHLLAHIPTRSSAAALEAALRDPDAKLRELAAWGLGRHKARAKR